MQHTDLLLKIGKQWYSDCQAATQEHFQDILWPQAVQISKHHPSNENMELDGISDKSESDDAEEEIEDDLFAADEDEYEMDDAQAMFLEVGSEERDEEAQEEISVIENGVQYMLSWIR